MVHREERNAVRLRNVLLSIASIALATALSAHAALLQNTTGRSAVFIPHESWTCGMAEGIPSPESGTLVFEAEMKFERLLDVGKTPYGNRQVVVMQEGTVAGAKLSGS